MDEVKFLEPGEGRRIAYVKTEAQAAGRGKPGVVFLGGLRSDMEGTKALALEEWARREGRAFLRFDYTGHGQSSGEFHLGCISDWAQDARDAIDALTDGPQILVGSSMGGWVSLLLARSAPERVAGLCGVAAAPDFTLEMEKEMDDAARQEMRETGVWLRPSDYSDEPYPIGARLIEDGRNNLVLNAPLRFSFPVRLMQGTEDDAVSADVAMRLLGHIEAPDLRLTFVKGADHRFSGEAEISLLIKAVEEVGKC